MSLSDIKKIKNDARTEPHIVIVSVSIHNPYASVNLQVRRVKALRAQSQLTSSAPLVVVHLNLIEQPHCTQTLL